jgi:group I intron endonuclease
MGVIYKITSPTNKVYVGKTYDLRKRINAHKACSRKGSSVILYNSIRKYGWDAHKLEVIEEVEDDKLNEREMFWIAELKTYCFENPMGLNMTKGGEGQRSTWMHDTQRRMDQSNKFKGEGNPFYGKKHPIELRKELSKLASKRNKKLNRTVPKWGAEKGRLKVIRAVICYDKYGNFLKEYDSISSAEKELKINHASICESCKGIITGVFGKYVFRYKEPNYPLKIEVGEVKIKSTKRPVLYLNKKLEVIKEYASASEAAVDLEMPKTTINRAALYNNLKPIRTGHIFIYKDLYEKQLKKIV